MIVIDIAKRTGQLAPFDKKRIIIAISKAAKADGVSIPDKTLKAIANEIEAIAEKRGPTPMTVREIEKEVFERLINKGYRSVARCYEGYRSVREYQRKKNLIDTQIKDIIQGTDKENTLNSNKNTRLISTIRDITAEAISKDIALRTMIPTHIAQAHKEGIIYLHDLGHWINPSFNCFTCDTRFLTRKGPKAFSECYEGQIVEVLDMDGEWQQATVHSYPSKPMQTITFKEGDRIATVRATYDHRWVLDSKCVTTNLCIGDVLYDRNLRHRWKVTKIDRSDATPYPCWCVDQPTNHTFKLEQGIVTGNCCLVSLDNIFKKGTVINGKKIEQPKSLRTAVTLMTQIALIVSSNQYGGQTMSIAHLAPYVRVSEEKIKAQALEEMELAGVTLTFPQIEKIVQKRLGKEISDAIQTLQYQLNTMTCANGQTPFISLFMYVNEDPEYEREISLLIEEILKQRIEGMKNVNGVRIAPAFPKLLYVLDENNIQPTSKYYYLTQLAAECVSKSMMPDFISAKIMRENYQGNVFGPMGCRAFLSPYKGPINNKKGDYKFYGRFNMGVVTINLAHVGLTAKANDIDFWELLNDRCELCHEALRLRYKKLNHVSSDVSPLHFQYGAISRLPVHSSIHSLLQSGYATISLGYIGVYECVKALIGESNTSPEGEKLALKIVKFLRKKVDEWKEQEHIGYALYGTPSESLTEYFAIKTREKFGVIPDITDKDWLTNSFHVCPREEIDAFSKLKYEAQFHAISSGGCISYVEMPNMQKNIPALLELIQFIYDNVQYAEFNTKMDVCQVCGFEGEILMDDNLEWYCPNCGNRDRSKMNILRRTCGYLGENDWCRGRRQEIKERVLHIGMS